MITASAAAAAAAAAARSDGKGQRRQQQRHRPRPARRRTGPRHDPAHFSRGQLATTTQQRHPTRRHRQRHTGISHPHAALQRQRRILGLSGLRQLRRFPCRLRVR